MLHVILVLILLIYPTWSQCTGNYDLSNVTTVCSSISGDLTIIYTYTEFTEEQIYFLDNLLYISGNVIIAHSEVSSSISLNNLGAIGGDLFLEKTKYSDILMTSLIGIGGDFKIEQLEITNVDGFSSLELIGGNLNVYLNRVLLDLNGFVKVKQVGGDVTIEQNWLMSHINFPSLTFLSGSLNILEMDSLTNLNGLVVEEVKDNLKLDKLEMLKNVDELNSIVAVGSLEITDLPNLTSIEGLSSISNISSLIINSNPLLRNLQGLENIFQVLTPNDVAINGTFLCTDSIIAANPNFMIPCKNTCTFLEDSNAIDCDLILDDQYFSTSDAELNSINVQFTDRFTISDSTLSISNSSIQFESLEIERAVLAIQYPATVSIENELLIKSSTLEVYLDSSVVEKVKSEDVLLISVKTKPEDEYFSESVIMELGNEGVDNGITTSRKEDGIYLTKQSHKQFDWVTLIFIIGISVLFVAGLTTFFCCFKDNFCDTKRM